ncbi:integrase arm-type DNA-binding domain-containing protein [Sedimentitalea sp.]|uniref:integrase arm-type DNA-binding domain-containing protein n=1 Tax=Sedimentitalea sp. TaxID=2048915 RepID=UPI0032976E9A
MKTETRHQKIGAATARTPLPEGVAELVVADTTLTGFRLRIRPSSRRYIYTGRVAGSGRRTVTLGDAASMTAAEARKAAQATRNSFLQGEDIKPKASALVSFAQVHEARHALWAAGKLRQQKKAPSPASVKGEQTDIQRALAHMGNLPVRNVTLDVVRAFLFELEQEDVGPDAKRRAMGAASRVMDYATSAGLADGNPFKMLSNFASAPPRERVLYLDEVHRIWDAAQHMDHAGPFLRLLVAQPLRLCCAATLRWRDVDMTTGVAVLPADMVGNKAKMPFHLALTGTALDVLRSVPMRDAEDFVFQGRTAGSRVWWGQDRADAFAALHGVPDFRLHDLRTAFSTLIADADATADVDAVELALGHKRKGVHAKYQRSFRLDAQREVGAVWDGLLSRG